MVYRAAKPEIVGVRQMRPSAASAGIVLRGFEGFKFQRFLDLSEIYSGFQ